MTTASEAANAAMKAALERADSALADNAHSQALGGNGINPAYYAAVQQDISRAMRGDSGAPLLSALRAMREALEAVCRTLSDSSSSVLRDEAAACEAALAQCAALGIGEKQ